MEFVGKTVKKECKGFGFVSGNVRSYDSSSGFLQILYENGDTEELDCLEVASRMEEGEAARVQQQVDVKPRVGRKPKKRRRVERKWEAGGNSGNEGTQEVNERFEVDNNGNSSGNVDLNDGFFDNLKESAVVDENLNRNLDLNHGFEQALGLECRSNKDLNETVNTLRNGIDLNAGFNLNLNERLYSGDWVNINVDYEENFNKRRGYIDLNLDVNCDVDENVGSITGTQKKECGFDLNLGVEDENGQDIMDAGFGGQGKESNTLHVVEDMRKMEGTCVQEGIANGDLKEVYVAGLSGVGLVEEIREEKGVLGKDCHFHDSDEIQVQEGLSEPSSKVIDGSQSDMGSSYKQDSGRRKRRKVLDNSNSAAEPVLRRSTRRMSAKNHISSIVTTCIVTDLSASPAVSGLTEEKPVLPGQIGVEQPVVLPMKLQLPPPSQNLSLDGVPVLDVFSSYACLRSFSTLLFLSPFELEDFVAALNCTFPSSLFDCIHFSILQTLRKHLEQLCNEGYQSASDCLRSLNWDLLDPVTWPLFMIEYLLIHGSALKPGFDLSRLKLFRNEYYKQPVAVKVEILQCLCDDLIEVEAIRSELNRRSLISELEIDFDRNVNSEVCKKRRPATDMSGVSYFTDEIIDDTTDWNSDECCLCKMDGNLICCDGCPAAYHSKCVGVANHLLPEGDWYCPECAFDRPKRWMKPRKSLRGAELLGMDSYGRQYYSSCGYLLVLDTSDPESFNYYHRNDLTVVLDVLKSSNILYGAIINAIYKQWDIPVSLTGAASNLDSLNSLCLNRTVKERNLAISKPLVPLASSEAMFKNDTVDREKVEEKCIAGYSGQPDFEVSESMKLLDSAAATETPYMSSEGSAEIIQIAADSYNVQKQVPDCYDRSADFLNNSEAPGKSSSSGDCFLTSNNLDINQESNLKFAMPSHTSLAINAGTENTSEVQCGAGYMNCYSFAQPASLIAEDLMHKSSDKVNEESMKPDEEIISAQMRAILKNSKKLRWPNILNLNVDARKEKCGWCFSCQGSVDEDCLFNKSMCPFWQLPESEMAVIQSKRKTKGHCLDVVCHMLCIENRLHGLLLGPWTSPQYTKLWRKRVLKASDISCLKRLLLTLEANLHHLALSAEWLKYVDSVATMGSASHIVIASVRACSKNGIGKRRGRLSDLEINHTSNAGGGLSMCWWRGGRLSRHLFNWKVLPISLASKAARQAGCVKIPGILYPENSDFPKRSKCVAWRAAVESSTTAEQLAFQVRELDMNIKWDDIENTHFLPTLDKEARKSIRLFKKAIIRRKCLEGDGAKYLLDFGKRRIIPNVVLRNGSMVEESSSERKKYWLNESHVPLHLLKSFEEKRIARKSVEISSEKLSVAGRAMNKSSKKMGFSYLFSRAERSENYRCGHCNKDILTREAVCCQYCKGFFHKRHVKRSVGAKNAESVYACQRCQDGKLVESNKNKGKHGARKGKINTKSLKHQSQKHRKVTRTCRSVRLKNAKKSLVGVRSLRSQNGKKVTATVPLRRSARRAQYISQQEKNKKPGGCKKRKQKPRKRISKKPKKGTSWQRKRTRVYYSYWLNGLLLSRKPNDERVMQFRREKYFDSHEHSSIILDEPNCFLCCEAGSMSTSSYIACDICGGWFHGDAYGLNAENISKLIGFRCHVCRKRSPPVCPHMLSATNDASKVTEEHNNAMIGHSGKLKDAVPCHFEDNQLSHLREDLQGFAPAEECSHKDDQLDVIKDIKQCLVSQSELEAKNGKLLANKKQNADALQISNKDLKPDTLTSNENVILEDRIDGTATSRDETEHRPCVVDIDVIETKSAPLRHNDSKDGIRKTSAILNVPFDGTLLESIELHPEILMASSELLDEKAKIV